VEASQLFRRDHFGIRSAFAHVRVPRLIDPRRIWRHRAEKHPYDGNSWTETWKYNVISEELTMAKYK
jgi:hypothetical protein